MFRSLETLRGYGLRATDGDVGDIQDVFFDDATWRVRYVVVDTGTWLPGRKVLLVPGCFGEPDPTLRRFPVGLTRDQVKNAPEIDADRPVSRQQEQALHDYYNWAPYWTGAVAPLWGAPVATGGTVPPQVGMQPGNPDALRSVDERAQELAQGDPHLRSAREVEGYGIAATDGEIGEIVDVLIDPEWHVRYFVVDTGKWLPGRRVLIAPDWVRHIDWAASAVEVDHTREEIRHSPEYHPERVLDRGFEEQLYGYYGRIPYWV